MRVRLGLHFRITVHQRLHVRCPAGAHGRAVLLPEVLRVQRLRRGSATHADRVRSVDASQRLLQSSRTDRQQHVSDLRALMSARLHAAVNDAPDRKRSNRASRYGERMKELGIVVLLVLGGCSGGNSGPIAIADLKDAYVKAECTYAIRCGAVVDDDATCVALASQVFTAFAGKLGFDNMVAAVSAGKVTYDATAAGECVDAIQSTPCDVTALAARIPPTACVQTFTGSGAVGAACVIDEECASNNCQGHLPGVCTMGTCAASAAALGQSCANIGCTPPNYCDGTTCQALAAKGAQCSLPPSQDNPCGDELSCVAGICDSLPAEGSACTSSCAEIGDVCSATTMTCVKMGQVGAQCATQGDCAEDLLCDASSMKCVTLPTLGQPCGPYGCSAGLACTIGSDGICIALAANGATCDSSSSCQSYYCDIPTSGLCAPEPTCD